MTEYQILSWHEFPAQIRVRDGLDRIQIELPPRFQERIDAEDASSTAITLVGVLITSLYGPHASHAFAASLPDGSPPASPPPLGPGARNPDVRTGRGWVRGRTQGSRSR